MLDTSIFTCDDVDRALALLALRLLIDSGQTDNSLWMIEGQIIIESVSSFPEKALGRNHLNEAIPIINLTKMVLTSILMLSNVEMNCCRCCFLFCRSARGNRRGRWIPQPAD